MEWPVERGSRKEGQSLLLGRLSVPIKSARRGQNIHCNPTIKNADLLGGAGRGNMREEWSDHEKVITGHSLSHLLTHSTQEGLGSLGRGLVVVGCLNLPTASHERLAVGVLWSGRQWWLALPECEGPSSPDPWIVRIFHVSFQGLKMQTLSKRGI